MASPITWQTVTAGTNADAAKGMYYAGHNINQAFEGLQGILNKREATQDANFIQGQNNDYAAQIANLRTYATPEALAEAQKANVFDNANAAGMGSANYVKFADQLRAAPAALMQQRVDKDAYNLHAQIQNEKPLQEAFDTFLTKKDFKGANKIVDTNSLANEAAFRTKLEAAQRLSVQDLRAAAGEQRAIGANNRSAEAHNKSMRDRDQLNSLNTLVSESATQYIKDTSAWEKNFKKVATEYDAKTNAIGNIDTSALSKEALNALHTRVGAPPSKDSYMAKMASRTAELGLAAHSASVNNSFSSVVNAATPAGATSPANIAAEEKIRNSYENAKKQNPFVSGSAAEDEEILGKINTKLSKAITGDTFFFGTGHPSEGILKLATQGIEITNSAGKTENFKVPPRLLQMAVDKAEIEDKTIVRNSSVSNVENIVNAMLKQDDYRKYLAESDLYKNNNRLTSDLFRHRNENIVNNPSEMWAKLIANRDSAAAAAARDGAANLKKP